MRVFLAVSAALFLFACNWVVTKAPLFSTADGAHAPRLRNGVWAFPSPDGCVFDQRKPITVWPDCVDVLIVRDGSWMALDRKDAKTSWTATSVVLAAGQPRILQMSQDDSSGAGSAPAGYTYYGLKPTRTDRQGRIIAYTAWPVLCGPPAPQTAETQKRSGTLSPFPGMTLDADDDDCTTGSRDAVRNAADASLMWPVAGFQPHWVRDGYR